MFRVLSDVLSDRKIKSGDVIEMRSLDPGQTPEPYAIVAVCFIWSGVLLLRQFVPPRMLITNSARRNLPNLHLEGLGSLSPACAWIPKHNAERYLVSSIGAAFALELAKSGGEAMIAVAPKGENELAVRAP